MTDAIQTRAALDPGTTWQAVLKKLAVPMEKQDLFVGKQKVERFQAVVLKDTKEVLSIVSPGYRLVQHDEAFQGLVKELSQDGWEFTRYSLEKHGAQAFIEAVNKKHSLLKEEKVYPRLTMSNAVDCRSSLKMSASGYRQVCENGLMVPDSRLLSLNLSTRHVGDVEGRFGLLRKQLAEKLELLKEVGAQYQGLMNQPVKEAVAAKLLAKMAGKRSLDRILYLWEHAPGQPKPYTTAWGLYNGLTYWLTHEAPGGVYARDLKSQQLLRLLLAKSSR